MSNETQLPTLPTFNSMIEGNYTLQDFLKYYKVIWTRNLAASTVDMNVDMMNKAKDPEEMVNADDGVGSNGRGQEPVKARLEKRKMRVQDNAAILKSINALLALTPEELEKNFHSEEALQVAPDMLGSEEKHEVGEECTTADGKAGRYMAGGPDGILVCMPVTESASVEKKETGV